MSPKDRLGDRRNDLRFEILGPMFGSFETVEPLPLHNVGRGGALVESRVELMPDALHTVRLGLNGDSAEVQARVRHVTPTNGPAGRQRFLVGLEFVGPGDEALKQIDRLVAATSGRGPGDAEA